MSRCYKVYPYSYQQSIGTKCVSEILQQQTHNNKRVWEAKLENGFVIVKSLGKYEQRYVKISAIIVVIPYTRLPMKQSD